MTAWFKGVATSSGVTMTDEAYNGANLTMLTGENGVTGRLRRARRQGRGARRCRLRQGRRRHEGHEPVCDPAESQGRARGDRLQPPRVHVSRHGGPVRLVEPGGAGGRVVGRTRARLLLGRASRGAPALGGRRAASRGRRRRVRSLRRPARLGRRSDRQSCVEPDRSRARRGAGGRDRARRRRDADRDARPLPLGTVDEVPDRRHRSGRRAPRWREWRHRLDRRCRVRRQPGGWRDRGRPGDRAHRPGGGRPDLHESADAARGRGVAVRDRRP